MLMPPFLIVNATNPPGFFPATMENASNPNTQSYWRLPPGVYEDHVKMCNDKQLTPKTREALLHDFYVTSNNLLQEFVRDNPMTRAQLIQHDCDNYGDYILQVVSAGRDGAHLNGQAPLFEMNPPLGEYVPRDVTIPSSEIDWLNYETENKPKRPAPVKKQGQGVSVTNNADGEVEF